MNTAKLIRVKQNSGTGGGTFAYVMLNISTKKSGYQESINIDITPITKDELLSSQDTENTQKNIPSEPTANRFSAFADVNSETVSIASGNRMFLTPNIRGKGIGSFALNSIIRWMIIKYPNFAIDPIEISARQFIDLEDRKRAISFLSNFGFKFKELPIGLEYEGTMQAGLCMNLREHINRDKIDELDISKFIRELLRERYIMEEKLKNQSRQTEENMVYMNKAEKDKFLSIILNIIVILGALFLLFYLK